MDPYLAAAASWRRSGRDCPCCTPAGKRTAARIRRARLAVETRRAITDGGC